MLRLISLFLILSSPQAAAQTRPESMLERSWRNCDVFIRAVGTTKFEREPDLWVCHDFDFKGLKIRGYIRFAGTKKYLLMLASNKHGLCTGSGTMAMGRERGRKHISASDRFECRDGSLGGTAWEVDYIREAGETFKVGTILAGIDGHRDRINNQADRVQGEFFVMDRTAIQRWLSDR